MKGEANMQKRVSRSLLSLLLGVCVSSAPAVATEIVYYPLNPSFGGNPLNGSVLLNSALTTNRHTDPDAGMGMEPAAPPTALQQFQESLERAVLSRLTSAATSNLFDPITGKLVPGTVETTNFTISIASLPGGLLSITTIDKANGNSTTFEVSQ